MEFKLKQELGYEPTFDIFSRNYNTHLIINPEGQIVGKYRKIHLVDVDLTSKGGIQLYES